MMRYSILVGALLVIAVHGEGTCDEAPVQLTSTDALGPFFVEGSPLTAVIAPRDALINPTDVFAVRGQIWGNDCVPLSNARVEAWYAGEDEEGVFYFDTKYRGQLVADKCGQFQFTQTFPAVYPQRPIPHIHYRISAADGTELLVTQLYFEGVVPSGFSPDDTKISQIVNEPDGSRSAEFNIYVSIPGTADLDNCDLREIEMGETSFPETIDPNYVDSMMPSDMDTIMPSEHASEVGMEEGTSEVGSACGPSVCEQGLECCNESCGTCVEPGGVCTLEACITVVLGEIADTDASITKTASTKLFD